jgi:kynurenine formamidase
MRSVFLLLALFAVVVLTNAHNNHGVFPQASAELLQSKAAIRSDCVDFFSPPLISGAFRKAIDLTQVMNLSAPGDVTADLHPTFLLQTDTKTVAKDYYFKQSVTIATGMGTHVDAPAHVYGPTTRTIDEFSILELFGPLVVVDVTTKVNNNPDYQVSLQDLQAWEQLRGRIPNRAFVVMKSGWSSRYYNENLYRNADASGVNHFPGFSGEAANWLIANRTINGVGVDTLSIDAGSNFAFPVHYSVLGADKVGIENLNLMDPRIPASGAYLFANPIKIQGAPEGNARVFVLAP